MDDIYWTLRYNQLMKSVRFVIFAIIVLSLVIYIFNTDEEISLGSTVINGRQGFVESYPKDKLSVPAIIKRSNSVSESNVESEMKKDTPLIKEEVESDKVDGDKEKKDITKNFTNKIGMTFLHVEAGEFIEFPQPALHRMPVFENTNKAVIRNDFHMAEKEVTQKQWEMVMGSLPDSISDSKFRKNDNYAVSYVSWIDAQEFLKKLSEMVLQNLSEILPVLLIQCLGKGRHNRCP